MSQPVSITINGSSESTLYPERGEVSLRISDSGPDPSHVSSEVRRVTREVRSTIEALKAQDYNPSDDADASSCTTTTTAPTTPVKKIVSFTATALQTRSWTEHDDDYSSSSRRKAKPKPKTHEASVRLTAKFASFSALGAFASSLADAPLVTIEGVSWSLTDATQATLRATAIKKAYDDALAKAVAFSEAMGRGGVVPVEVRTHSDGMEVQYGGRPGYGAMMMSRRAVPGGGAGDEGVDPVPKDVAYQISCEVKFECR
ncbi:hypothetical protein K461DRAFT_81700 [Myriangium duriaei CBS 260.36]|uniref:DUF541 domain-containing protein n=1 Tax=Myriangium duriaei CBS 260.36 TaxID=1168546 RepID=A0A9P4J9V2_9PEZI|nr:hypothetical protein K461DRAFT_81700 [Myriangium duriaei CBS 260.36]